MPMPRPVSLAVRALAIIAVLAGLLVLFVRSAEDARSAPYTVGRSLMAGWVLTVEEPRGPAWPVVSLAAPPELPMRLFRQVFTRVAETLNTPARPGIPLVLAGELAGASGVSPADLVELARRLGLESTPLEPVCVAQLRDSAPGIVRQLYVVAFNLPGFTPFREAAAERLRAAGGGAAFDPAAFSPTLIVGASDEQCWRWMPLVVDPARDCKAPIAVE